MQKIIDEMTPNSQIALLHDADPDGICSGVLFDSYLQSQDKRIMYRTNPLAIEKPFTKPFIQKLEDNNITHIFILDYNLAGYGWTKEYEEFRQVYPDIKVCVIDHHPYTKDFDFDFHANTVFDQNQISGDQYCTSKYIYDILMIVWPEVKALQRIAAIGVIGDWNHKTWGLFVQDAVKEENSLRAKQSLDDIKIPKDFEEYFACPFGKIALYIFYGLAKDRKQVSYIFDLLRKNLSVEDMIMDLEKYVDVEEEVDDYIDNFEYCVKNTPLESSDLAVFELELKSQHDILVITANLISLKDKNTLFMLYERQGDYYIISLRMQSGKVHLGELMKQSTKIIEGSNGGGHACAAGGRVPKAHFDDFKERFYKTLEKVK